MACRSWSTATCAAALRYRADGQGRCRRPGAGASRAARAGRCSSAAGPCPASSVSSLSASRLRCARQLGAAGTRFRFRAPGEAHPRQSVTSQATPGTPGPAHDALAGPHKELHRPGHSLPAADPGVRLEMPSRCWVVGESVFHANGEPGLAEVSRCTRTGSSVEAADRHPPGGWAKGMSTCLCR